MNFLICLIRQDTNNNLKRIPVTDPDHNQNKFLFIGENKDNSGPFSGSNE